MDHHKSFKGRLCLGPLEHDGNTGPHESRALEGGREGEREREREVI